jgi:hypothetical protein
MSEKSEKSSERKMTELAEAQMIVAVVAGPDGSAKERVLRASRLLSRLSFSRVRDLFYADPRCRVRADELDYLRRMSATRQKEAAKNEFAELLARIERVENLLRAVADAHRPLDHAPCVDAGASHRAMDR